MNRVAIRLIGAPLLLAALGLALYVDWATRRSYAVGAILVLFSLGAYHELCAMGRARGLHPAEVLGLAALLILYARLLDLIPWSGPLLELTAGAVVATLLLLLVVRFGRFSPPDAGFTLLALVYVALLATIFLLPKVERSDWFGWLLFLVATGKGSDMAAYSAGKMVGRRKLAPSVSPNKTWEGAIAGFIAGTCLGVAVLALALSYSRDPVRLWGLSASVTVAAQFGDLVKSAVKRWAGVKDSGRWIPEFGGALDMVDSFLLAAPAAVAGVALFRHA